jgi:hypothetical protein
VSIAAVLMLGVGVTLRMQMEQPGVETSVPARELAVGARESAPPPATSSVAAKPAEAPAPQPQPEAKPKSRLAAPAKPAPAPLQERGDASPREEDSAMAIPAAPGPIAPPAANFVPSPPPAAAPPAAAANRVAPAVMRDQAAPAARSEAAPAAAGAVGGLQLAEPQRAKQEFDALAAKELKKSAALPDRDAELERIAKLREAGKHAEADRALEEFRKRYPDFRIPEAMWERVRPR